VNRKQKKEAGLKSLSLYVYIVRSMVWSWWGEENAH